MMDDGGQQTSHERGRYLGLKTIHVGYVWDQIQENDSGNCTSILTTVSMSQGWKPSCSHRPTSSGDDGHT